MNTKTHYIAMNGSIGCIPDNVEVYDTLEDAVDGILYLFWDWDTHELRDEFERELKENRIFYFPSSGYGADYCEIVEEPCIGEENGCECHNDGW